MTDKEVKQAARDLEEALQKAGDIVQQLISADGYVVHMEATTTYGSYKDLEWLESIDEVNIRINRRVL